MSYIIFLHFLFAFLIHNGYFEVVKNQINDHDKGSANYILLIVTPDAPADQNCKGTFGDVRFPLHKTLKPMSYEHFKKDANSDSRSYKDVCSKCFEDRMKDLLAWAQADRKMNTVSITVSNLYVAENDLGKVARDPNKKLLDNAKSSVNHIHHSHNKKVSHPRKDKFGMYNRLRRSAGYGTGLQSDADPCTDPDDEECSQTQPVVDSDDFDLLPDEESTDGVQASYQNQLKCVSDREVSEDDMLDQMTLEAKEKSSTPDQIRADDQSVDYFDKISDFPVAISGDGLKSLEIPQFDNVAKLDVPTSTQRAVQNDLSTQKAKHRHPDEPDVPLGMLQEADDPGHNTNNRPLFALVPAIPVFSSYDRQSNFPERIDTPPRNKEVQWIVLKGLGNSAGPKKRNKHLNKDDDEDLNSTTERFKYRTTCSELDTFTLPKSTKKYLNNNGEDIEEPEIECATQPNDDVDLNELSTKKPWKPLATTLGMLVTYKTVGSDLFTMSCKPQVTTPIPPPICPISCPSEKTTMECSTSTENEMIVEHLPSMGLPISHSGTQEERRNQQNFQHSNQVDAKDDTLLNLISSLKDNFHHTFLDSMPLSPEGDPSAPSMLVMTQNLLNQMESMPTANGYIASIRGGRVSDLKNCSSELVKTLHFIMNLCDGDRTVVVLTASCPEDNRQVPFLVSGAEIDNFDKVQELGDVPREIQAHIEGSKNQRTGDDVNKDWARFKVKKSRVLARKQNGGRLEHVETPIDKINQLFDSFPNGEKFGDELAESLVAPSDVWYSDIKIDSEYDKMAEETNDDDNLQSRNEHVVKRASSCGCANIPQDIAYEILIYEVMLLVVPTLMRQ